MKRNEINDNQIPVLEGRNGARVERATLDDLKTAGTPFSGAGMAKGDMVEFLDEYTEREIAKVEVRPNSDSWDWRALVRKNGKLAWLSIGFLVRKDVDRKPIHPVSEELSPLHDYYEVLSHCAGKIIAAPENIEYEAARWDNGRIVDGVTDTKTSPKLVFDE